MTASLISQQDIIESCTDLINKMRVIGLLTAVSVAGGTLTSLGACRKVGSKGSRALSNQQGPLGISING